MSCAPYPFRPDFDTVQHIADANYRGICEFMYQSKNYKLKEQKYVIVKNIESINADIEVLNWIKDNVECDWAEEILDCCQSHGYYTTKYITKYSFSDIETATLFQLKF